MSAPVLPDDQIEVPAVVVPDRADAPISEITERFFRALLTKVPLERIEEVHLFSPLRSGGVETGIAVIAARELVVVPPVIDEPLPLPLLNTTAATDDTATVDTATVDTATVDATTDEVVIDQVVIDQVVTDEAATDEVSMDEVVTDEAATDEATTVIAEAAIEVGDESPYADDDQTAEFDVTASAVPDDTPAALQSDVIASLDTTAASVSPIASAVRHTVYTARYRLVQKGPERGKWETNVVAEAEAPLITVETVVRGVQRRAGEESETTRFTAAQLARALRIEYTASA